jgi:hypothetical protein
MVAAATAMRLRTDGVYDARAATFVVVVVLVLVPADARIGLVPDVCCTCKEEIIVTEIVSCVLVRCLSNLRNDR